MAEQYRVLMLTIFSVLKNIDRVVFLFINNDSDKKILDPVMVALRNQYTWIPLYVFLLWYSFTRMQKNAIHFLILSIVVLTITDLTCYRVFKPLFERIRPCNDPELAGMARILVDCAGGYSFPSNHAANHFGLATFWFCYIKNILGTRWHWLWVWSAMICYAQIYVGKHFPSDVIAGALLGILTGFLVFHVSESSSAA